MAYTDATYVADDISPISIDLIGGVIAFLVPMGPIIGLFILYKWVTA